jgi:hypothetical protein
VASGSPAARGTWTALPSATGDRGSRARSGGSTLSAAPRIIYTSHANATSEAEALALAAVYKFVLASKKATEQAPKPNDPDAAAKVRHNEGVNHVDLVPDR